MDNELEKQEFEKSAQLDRVGQITKALNDRQGLIRSDLQRADHQRRAEDDRKRDEARAEHRKSEQRAAEDRRSEDRERDSEREAQREQDRTTQVEREPIEARQLEQDRELGTADRAHWMQEKQIASTSAPSVRPAGPAQSKDLKPMDPERDHEVLNEIRRQRQAEYDAMQAKQTEIDRELDARQGEHVTEATAPEFEKSADIEHGVDAQQREEARAIAEEEVRAQAEDQQQAQEQAHEAQEHVQ